MIVISPATYIVTLLLFAVGCLGVFTVLLRYRRGRTAKSTTQLIASPFALVGIATMFVTRSGGLFLVIAFLIQRIGDVLQWRNDKHLRQAKDALSANVIK